MGEFKKILLTLRRCKDLYTYRKTVKIDAFECNENRLVCVSTVTHYDL